MDETDHDTLIEVARDVCWLKKMTNNHLKHHEEMEAALIKHYRAIYIALAGVAGMFVIALILKWIP